MIFLSLVLSEVSVIRLLTKLVWKRIPPMNPDPFATFLEIRLVHVGKTFSNVPLACLPNLRSFGLITFNPRPFKVY